jgi:hypothetical protein
MKEQFAFAEARGSTVSLIVVALRGTRLRRTAEPE